MSADYRLVPFAPADLPELTNLWIAAWSQAMPAIDFDARHTWFVDHMTKLRAAGVAVTCAFDTANGALAAFITRDEASGHIDQLAAAPAYWAKGAAKALIDDAKRCTACLTLDVNQENPRAVRFYEKLGFRRTAAGVNPTSGLKTWRYEWNAVDS